MRKNTFLSVALLAASVSVVNAQEAPKELFWQNSSNTGIWSIMDSEWGEDLGGFYLPTGWQEGCMAVFNGGGAFADADGNAKTVESIKVSGEMQVGGIKFDSDKNYSISYSSDKATDKIVGDGTLIKEGTGTLTLNVLNQLKGGTIVRGGQVNSDKKDSPNVFGDTIVLDNGSIGVAMSEISTPACQFTVPVGIPEGKVGSIWAGRYLQFTNKFYGKGTLVIYAGGERTYITDDKAGKKDMTCWDDFEGDLVVAANKTVEYAEGKAPAFFGLQFNTTKTFTGVADMEGIDSTLVNTKVTLKEDAGLTGVSGTRCFAIGELNAEEGGFLSGYGSGSSNPVIWWSIGNSNTDVTNLPLWLRDNTKANKNAFGVIKEGAGTYIFTGTKNSDTGKVFLGLHVKKGRAYINTPVDDPTITALCRSEKTAMAIYEGAIGGGNGRITSEVIVDGGTLEVGCQGIGQLILDDIEGQSLKSPLTVKNGGTVEFELANATSYDKLTSNNTATFNGNKIIVKAAETFDIKDGDSFTILDAAIKPEGDTYEVEFQGFPTSLTLAATEESYQSGTKTEGEGETATEVPVMGYKIVITAKGSGSGTGLEDFNVADELAVYAQNGSIVVKGAGVENVIVMNTQGQVVANTNASIIPMNTVQGMYIVKVKTIAGIVTKKVIL